MATVRAVLIEKPRAQVIAKAVRGFATRMIPRVARMIPGLCTNVFGSNSIPIEAKNKTAKASRMGNASAAAWWLTSDWATATPARKAPSAIETPKNRAEPVAMARAMASTVRMKSSRERDRATCESSHGIAHLPMNSRRPPKITSFTMPRPGT